MPPKQNELPTTATAPGELTSKQGLAPSQALLDELARRRPRLPIDQSSDERVLLKDIVPGDQINQQAAISQAYAQMGSSMAAEIKNDQHDKEALQKFAKNAGRIENMASYSGLSEGSNFAVGEVSSFFLSSFIKRLVKPVPGSKPSIVRRSLYIAASLIVLAVIGFITAHFAGDFFKSLLSMHTN
jgi:hypothetical protein